MQSSAAWLMQDGPENEVSVSDSEPKKFMGKCPLCGTKSDVDYRPFCSNRCKELDLAHWLRGTYAIPGPPAAAFPDDEDGGDDGEM
jgi:uncharacterized protein